MGFGSVENARLVFAFEPRRNANFLLAGDKTNQWAQWYKDNIPVADRIYDEHMEGMSS